MKQKYPREAKELQPVSKFMLRLAKTDKVHKNSHGDLPPWKMQIARKVLKRMKNTEIGKRIGRNFCVQERRCRERDNNFALHEECTGFSLIPITDNTMHLIQHARKAGFIRLQAILVQWSRKQHTTSPDTLEHRNRKKRLDRTEHGNITNKKFSDCKFLPFLFFAMHSFWTFLHWKVIPNKISASGSNKCSGNPSLAWAGFMCADADWCAHTSFMLITELNSVVLNNLKDNKFCYFQEEIINDVLV